MLASTAIATVLLAVVAAHAQCPVSFASSQTLGVGFQPFTVAVGDFNGDGVADLVFSSNTGGGIVSVRLGNGNGSFSGPTNYSVGAFPYRVRVADFNGDGTTNPDGLGDYITAYFIAAGRCP